MRFSRLARFASASGGTLSAITPEGELLLDVAVPPGIVHASPFIDLLPDGSEWALSDGLSVVEPRSGYAVQEAPGMFNSAANPDFAPSSADSLQREMLVQLNRMKAATRTAERYSAAAAQLERIPQGPGNAAQDADDGEVVEAPAPAPAPEPAPAPAPEPVKPRAGK